MRGAEAGRLDPTDPDSSEVVPSTSPRFAGDFVLDSQGDEQLIYVRAAGTAKQRLSVLYLSVSIDAVQSTGLLLASLGS